MSQDFVTTGELNFEHCPRENSTDRALKLNCLSFRIRILILLKAWSTATTSSTSASAASPSS